MPQDSRIKETAVCKAFSLENSRKHSQGKHKQNEKTTHKMGEQICKWSNWQGNLQNIQTAHASQHQKNKQPNQKMSERS